MTLRVPRRGFALLAILWTLVGISVLALGASAIARTSLATAKNRVTMTSLQWRAEGCLACARASLDQTFTKIPPSDVIAAWDTLDAILRHSDYFTDTQCTVDARAVGDAIDINTIDAERLHRGLVIAGVYPSRADSLVAALLDWRDDDDVARPTGAERAWYTRAARIPPRDSQFANIAELQHVRGFEHFADTLRLFTTERGRIALSHAPIPVLATLPGMTPDALAVITSLRARHERATDFLALGGRLGADARQELLAHYQELNRSATVEPDGWILTVSVQDSSSALTGSVRVRLARAGTRVAIMSQWSS
jgi:type II secretory pathway component PulK